MAEAELLITPDVARAELNRAINQLEKAMETAAKHAGKDFQQEIAKGIKKGGKDGLTGIGGAGGPGGMGSSNMIDGLKKAGGVLGGAAAIALGVGLSEIMGRVDIGTSLIDRMVGESKAPETLAGAQKLGLSGAEYQAIREQFAKAGITDDADILETLREITVQTEEGERGENELLSEFAGMRGMDLFRAVFASVGNMQDTAQQMAVWASLNEEVANALAMVSEHGFKLAEEGVRAAPQGGGDTQVMEGGRSAGFSEQAMFPLKEAHQQRAEAFQKEAQKVEEFRTRQYEQTAKENAKFWDTFDADAANAYFSRQDAVFDQQVAALQELSRNVGVANTVDAEMKKITDALAASAAQLVTHFDKLSPILDAIGKFAVDANQGVGVAAGNAAKLAWDDFKGAPENFKYLKQWGVIEK